MSSRPGGGPLFARAYTRLRPVMDRGGLDEHRRRLLAGLSGRVIEVGAGDGGNFAHYPPAVTAVLAVEPQPYLRARARAAAAAAPVPVSVTGGAAERLPAADGTYDAAVVSLVLCSVPDQLRALQEFWRVLRPGGELRFLEHVRAATKSGYAIQRALDATLWPVVAGGCHASRDTAAAIEAAGLEIEWVDRLRFPAGRFPTPTAPHILGVARRPAPRPS